MRALQNYALIASLALAVGCVSIPGWMPGVAETPAQAFYENYSHWVTVKEVAVSWAESPAGQSRPVAVGHILLTDTEVQQGLDRLAVSLCMSGTPTAENPAPPPLPNCVPLTGVAADNAYAQTAEILTLGSATLRDHLTREGAM